MIFLSNKVDPCSSFPCLYGSKCKTVSTQSYTCQCLPGYSGQNCEKCNFELLFQLILINKSFK